MNVLYRVWLMSQEPDDRFAYEAEDIAPGPIAGLVRLSRAMEARDGRFALDALVPLENIALIEEREWEEDEEGRGPGDTPGREDYEDEGPGWRYASG